MDSTASETTRKTKGSANDDPPVQRLTYRFNELEKAVGLDRRTIERYLAKGEFPPPDRRLGRISLWRRETIADWLAGPSANGGSSRTRPPK